MTSSEAFIGSSPHPWAPTVSTIFETHFTPEEQHIFEQALRPRIEAPTSAAVSRIAYLVARKV